MESLITSGELSKNGNMENGFGQALSEYLKTAGISAYRLAKESGLSESYINNLVKGRRPPTDETLEKIAPVLGVSIEELKKEALRMRLSSEDLRAAADIVAEEAEPKDIIRQVKVHFRAKDIPAEGRGQYLKELAELIQAADDHWDDI